MVDTLFSGLCSLVEHFYNKYQEREESLELVEEIKIKFDNMAGVLEKISHSSDPKLIQIIQQISDLLKQANSYTFGIISGTSSKTIKQTLDKIQSRFDDLSTNLILLTDSQKNELNQKVQQKHKEIPSYTQQAQPKPQPQQYKQTQQQSKSSSKPILKIIKINESIPSGYRILEFEEAKQYKSQITSMLGQWSIVAFSHGKLDGVGYGNKFQDSYGPECGEKVIIKED